MATWTEELRQKAIDKYLASEPTGDTSVEIAKAIAEEMGFTPNGVRSILQRAEPKVWITKEIVTSSTSSTAKKEVKEAKADSLKRLKDAISATGLKVDNSIVDKLTGKAAAYFADVISTKETEDD